MAYQNLEGQKFGRLTVVSLVGKTKGGNCVWDCVCECGNHTRVSAGNLKKGAIKSCGCLRKERFLTHGKSHTPLHHIWVQMKQRCYNRNDKSYKWYGGKGVSLCNEWMNYESFCDWARNSGYRKGLTIDRIDSSLGYSPENCRWIPIEENAKRAQEKFLCVDGEIMNMGQWSERIGLASSVVARWVQTKGEKYAEARILSIIHPENHSIVDAQKLNPNGRERYFTVDDVTLSLSGWAKKVLVHTTTIERWVSIGSDYAEERIRRRLHGDKPGLKHTNERFLTIEGRTLNHAKWAKEIGVSATSVCNWAKKGDAYLANRIMSYLTGEGK